nr:MAG TPA: hypothetical protein [Bacteriophage sp.]
MVATLFLIRLLMNQYMNLIKTLQLLLSGWI